MANLKDMGIYDVTFKADQDLSAYQYFVVEAASSNGYVQLATGSSGPAPIGVVQVDTASNIGDPVALRMFGPTKAWVAAATSAGTACDVATGDYLGLKGASGYLCWSGIGAAVNARALEPITTGCAFINVFFLPFAACANEQAN